jgi:hypothetical protein
MRTLLCLLLVSCLAGCAKPQVAKQIRSKEKQATRDQRKPTLQQILKEEKEYRQIKSSEDAGPSFEPINMPPWILGLRGALPLFRQSLHQLRKDLVAIQSGSFRNKRIELNHKAYALWLLLAYGMECPAIRVSHELPRSRQADFYFLLRAIRAIREGSGLPIDDRSQWRKSWIPL